MQDCHKRNIDYLRVSLTNRCNLRCQYCMPKEGIKELENLLSTKDLIHLVKLICSTGIRKVRLTGGEPLLYPEIDSLIESIQKIPSVEKIVMTTNGILLQEKAPLLAQYGLNGINLSLDCMNKALFSEITRGGDINRVFNGIRTALHYGIKIKLNSVIMKGINEQEVIPLIEFAKQYKIDLRFIELMPINVARNFKAVDEDLLKALIEENYGSLIPVDSNEGPAHYFKCDNLSIKIGFISALSHKFCSNCNRMRLTSTGLLKPCLHNKQGIDLQYFLKNNVTDEELLTIIKEGIYNKPQKHHLEDNSFAQREDKSMSMIGG